MTPPDQVNHEPTSRSGRRVNFLRAFAIAVIVLAALYWYATRSNAPVHFIFPAGSRGTFVALVDPQHGIEIPLINGEFVYQFPDHGPLLVKSNAPMQGWHKERASFADGMPLPIDGLSQGSPGGLLLRNSACGIDGKQEFCWFYIGTLSEEFDPNESLSELLAVGSRPAK